MTVDGHTYEVEVDDPRARPVIARVAGETFAVNVDSDAPTATAASPLVPTTAAQPAGAATPGGGANPAVAGGPNVLGAPIPGTVVAIMVAPGKPVERGDELVTIEAMKMFNVIRSPRAGIIAEVHVSERKRVAQGDPLVTFAP